MIADISQESHSFGANLRIGPKFLNANVGFDGSSFQKEILNLVYICESNGNMRRLFDSSCTHACCMLSRLK